jgi:hypothetical protein
MEHEVPILEEMLCFILFHFCFICSFLFHFCFILFHFVSFVSFCFLFFHFSFIL